MDAGCNAGRLAGLAKHFGPKNRLELAPLVSEPRPCGNSGNPLVSSPERHRNKMTGISH